MDLATLREILKPFVEFFAAIVLSGAATTAATEIMKLRAIFIPAGRYPRITAAVVSVIASLVAFYTTSLNVVFNTFWAWLFMAVGTLIMSAITYNHLVNGADIPTQNPAKTS